MKILVLILAVFSFSAFSKKQISLNENNSISFSRAYRSDYVSKKIVEASNKCLAGTEDDIYIVMYTPGGSVAEGQRFIEYLNALPCKFHTITIFAASMGYITAQLLEGKRYILESGILMSHRMSVGGLSGEVGGELNSVLNLIENNALDIDKQVTKRLGNVTVKKYREMIRDELWLTAPMSVKMNHADEVIEAFCDISLLGVREEVVRTFFGSYTVTFSKCPLVTAPLDVKGNKRGLHKIKDMLTNVRKYIHTTQ